MEESANQKADFHQSTGETEPSPAQISDSQAKDISISFDSQTVRTVLSAKGILAVVFAAIGYFLGWRFLFSYYGGLGLDPSFFTFAPTDVIFAGWRLYMLIAVLVIVAALSIAPIQKIFQIVATRSGLPPLIRVFYVLVVIGLALMIWCGYQALFVLGAHHTLSFFVWSFATLAILWIALVLGERIYSEVKIARSQHLPSTLFRVLFASPLTWLTIVGVWLIVTMTYFSSWNGWLYSRRDRDMESRLQIVSLYVDRELDISNGQVVRQGVWLYDELRFVFKTDDTFFAFRPEEVQDGIVKLYAVPREHIVEFHLKSWLDKLVHTGP